MAPAQARVGLQGGKGRARQVTKRPTLKTAEPGKQGSDVLCGLRQQRCSMGQGLCAAWPPLSKLLRLRCACMHGEPLFVPCPPMLCFAWDTNTSILCC